MKKKTLIGVADLINLTTEEKCGGAAVSKAKTNLDVSLRSTSVKKKMMRKTMTTTKKRTKLSSSSILDALAAKKWGIPLKFVQETRI
jgi:hypothetical protein